MPGKILIVDDDVDTLKLVGLMLQKQGFQILAANNGVQGLEQALAEIPDLILLDIMMPEMDGYEVARRLRENPDTASIPILMFTAKTQLDDKVTGFEAGADDYLTKPTHPSELIAHVKALLARSTKGRASAAPVKKEERAFVTGIIAPRGGLGVTTVAANLGSSLLKNSRQDVIVTELRPGMGTLGLDMGDPDPTTLATLLKTNQADLSRQKVKDSLAVHSSGVHFLYGTIRTTDAALLDSSEQVDALINRLTYLAAYLVLDLGSGLTSLNQKLVKGCHAVVVVTEPVPNSLTHAKVLIQDLFTLGVDKKHILSVLVNRIRSDTQMNWNQAQEHLGSPVTVAVTPAPELLHMATRMKSTAVDYQADSLTAQQFDTLAKNILELKKKMG